MCGFKEKVSTSGNGRSPGGDHKIWVLRIIENLAKLKKDFYFPSVHTILPYSCAKQKFDILKSLTQIQKLCTDFYYIQACCQEVPYHLCSFLGFCQLFSGNTCDKQVNFKLEFLVQTIRILVNSLNQKFKVHQSIKSRAEMRKIAPSSLWRISVLLKVAIRSTKPLWPPSSVKLIMQIFCPLVKYFASENMPIL